MKQPIQTLPLYFNHAEVRTAVIDDETWFVARDVCDVLGYANTSKSLSDHVRDKNKSTLTISYSDQKTTNNVFVNEPGLYALVMRSNKPEAERFQDWVYEEVLPALRRHGRYGPAAGAEMDWPARERRVRLIEAILGEAREPVRQALHEDLTGLCTHLGVHRPALADLPPTAEAAEQRLISEYREHGVKFWQAVREIVAQKHAVNHATRPDLCALNLPQIQGLARMNGYRLAAKSRLKLGLAALDAPRFIEANRSVKSAITDRSVRCWVFETDEFTA